MILFSQRQNKASERNILICYGTWYSAILDVADKADEVSVMHRVHHILKIKFKDFRGKVWDTYRGKNSCLFVCNVHHRFIAGSDLWHMRCVSIRGLQSSKLRHSGLTKPSRDRSDRCILQGRSCSSELVTIVFVFPKGNYGTTLRYTERNSSWCSSRHCYWHKEGTPILSRLPGVLSVAVCSLILQKLNYIDRQHILNLIECSFSTL